MSCRPNLSRDNCSALRSNLTLYRDAKASKADRAVALSWVLHLTGDITQPLHVTALMNKDFSWGDRGGNEIRVAGSERARKDVKLHKMWDDGASGPGCIAVARRQHCF